MFPPLLQALPTAAVEAVAVGEHRQSDMIAGAGVGTRAPARR